MHHRRPGHLDVDHPAGPAVGADHAVLHLVPEPEAVRDGVQLTSARIPFRVGGVTAGQGAVEIARADRVEFLGQLPLRQPALDQRERAAGVPDHVRIGADAGERGGVALPEPPGEVRGADPAVAVPLGAPVAQPDAVNHAVAEEPVVSLRVCAGKWIGAITEITAVEVLGDVPGHLEPRARVLTAHRGEVVFEELGAHRCSPDLITLLYRPGITGLCNTGKHDREASRQ